MMDVEFHMDINTGTLTRYIQSYRKFERVIERVGFKIERDTSASIHLKPTRYNAYVRKGGIVHYSSEPDYAPNSDSGHLADSTFFNWTGNLMAEVVNIADYALALELGTSRMEARPFLGPAVMKNAPFFHRACRSIMMGRG